MALKSVRGPLLAVLGGVVCGLCFGREPLAIVPWIALVPLVLLLGDRAAAKLGFLHGVAYWLTSLGWIRGTLETFGRLPEWLSWILLVGLVIYLGAYTWIFAWLGRRLWTSGGARALFGLPALWVTLEWVRTYVWTGFPWNLAGYSWVRTPGVLETSAWIGSYGLSYLVVWVSVGLALAIRSRRPAIALAVVGSALALLGFGARWAGGVESESIGQPVRLVQPNISNQVTWDPIENRASYDRLLRLSEKACDRPGALVVWPEGAAWPRDWASDPGLRSDVDRLTRRGCFVLLNSARREGERYYNSALLIGPEGEVGSYDKRHLVPYGEHVPLARWLPFIGTIARMAGQFTPGTEARLLPWASEQLGPAICFEVIFQGEVAEMVRAGATMLVTVTNDAWYGDTFAPWQHFTAARFRAAEMRRPLLRAAVTGVSGVIGPDGTVIQSLGVFEEGVIRANVHGTAGLSPTARWPWAAPFLSALMAAFAIFLGGSRAVRASSRRAG